jgi:hypothetical protein
MPWQVSLAVIMLLVASESRNVRSTWQAFIQAQLQEMLSHTPLVGNPDEVGEHIGWVPIGMLGYLRGNQMQYIYICNRCLCR